MPWITAADSLIGNREEQQDRYLIEHSDDGKNHLLVVADGAGGHETGGLAAQTAVDCISENLNFLWSSEEPDAFLNKLIIECNERVLAIGHGELACTTLVLALIKGDEIFWAHVGDSRFYLIRNQHVIVRTTDHSVVELQRQQASQSCEVTASAPVNELYMCLGALTEITPDVSSSLAREGDTLLLCSDGLWGQIDMEPVIADLSNCSLTVEVLRKWAETASNSKPDRSDNVTLVAARLNNKVRFFSNPFKAIIRLFRK